MKNIFSYVMRSVYGGTSDLVDPKRWLLGYAMGGRRTVSGEVVNEQSAMTLAAFYACLRNLSEDMGKLPIVLYRRLPRGKERATNHPIYRLLHDQPNPEMGPSTFKETVQHLAAGWGSGFAEIEQDGAGNPINLWPIHSSRVQIKRNDAGALVYIVKSNDVDSVNKETVLPAERMFHLRGLGPSGIAGYSSMVVGAEALGMGLAVQKFGSSFFANGAHHSGVLEHPAALSKEAADRLRESWQTAYGGAENSHKVAILEEGMKFNPNTIPPEECQFILTNDMSVEQICRLFRMPPHKIQHYRQAQGWSTLEATNQDYVTDTLLPWSVRWQQEINMKLLSEKERGVYFAEFLFIALLAAAAKDRAEFYSKMQSMGVLSPNDIRELENMNPIPGGDIYLVPVNFQTLENAAKAPAATAPSLPPPGDEPVAPATEDASAQVARLRPVFLAEAKRVCFKESRMLEEGSRKSKTPDELDAWLAEFKVRNASAITEAFEPILNSLELKSTCLRAPIERHCQSAFILIRAAHGKKDVMEQRVALLESDYVAFAAELMDAAMFGVKLKDPMAVNAELLLSVGEMRQELKAAHARAPVVNVAVAPAAVTVQPAAIKTDIHVQAPVLPAPVNVETEETIERDKLGRVLKITKKEK